MDDEPPSMEELARLEALLAAASPGPWTALVAEPGDSWADCIRLGGLDDAEPDMYVQHESAPAPVADLEFIAAARNCVPRLIAEVRESRGA